MGSLTAACDRFRLGKGGKGSGLSGGYKVFTSHTSYVR